MTNHHRYIDVHIIQTVPPSNLNRDDAGSPKQAIYGGARRARVSSQAWKRATRKYFAEQTPTSDQATRTLRLTKLLADRIEARSGVERSVAERIGEALRKPLKLTGGKKEGDTAYLLFFGRAQLDSIVEQLDPLLPDIAELEGDDLDAALADVSLQKALSEGHPVDVALFGRMVADLPSINVDASVQVAHAISTHAVETEFDYFTAVDDEKSRDDGDDAGAGMIGTIEFNSATLYRFATIGVDLLAENLDGAASATASAAASFVEGFARSMPTGHQNAFAHRTLPDAVVVVVRDDQPVNLVTAFEEPVRSRTLAATSLKELADELQESSDRWGSTPAAVVANYRSTGNDGTDEALKAAFGPSVPFGDLLDAVKSLAAPAPVET